MELVSVRRTSGMVGLAGGLMLVMATTASAHPGHSTLGGAAAGFAHPFSGLDHVLAMVAVGIWAAQQGGRATWMVPASFVGVMLAGAVVGLAGAPLPLAESSVALSVLLSGVMVAAFVRPSLVVAMLIAAAFAFCHGYVHGSEMSAGPGAATFVAGMVAATVLLQAMGITIAVALRERAPVAFVPALGTLGAVVAAIGALLLVRPGFFA